MNLFSKWIFHPQWVVADKDAPYGNPSPYFRKEFCVEGKIKKATLQITALGICKVKVNGKYVAEDRFIPGWTDYRQRLYYETFDVTALLGRENCIVATLGDGWYMGRLGLTFARNFYGDTPMLRAQLTVEKENGESLIFGTDESWKCSFGEIRGNDFFNGEIWDSREKRNGCDSYGYDDSGWVTASISAKSIPTPQPSPCEYVASAEELTPISTTSVNGKTIYDFGQNMAGVLRVRLKGAHGAKLVLRHGEFVQKNGELYTGNLRTALATDTYICNGEESVFEPIFTYHGFRYAEISVEGEIEVLSVKALVVWSELERNGRFTCDNPIIAQVYKNALWGQKGNFVSVPTDCPQRDERLGWTGDAQIFCVSAMYNYNCKRFYEKYLVDVQDATTEGGDVPIIAPYSFEGRHSPSAGWGDVITILPYEHYKTYGDKKILQDNLPYMEKWLRYCEEHSSGYIRFGHTYGDWLNVEDDTDFSVFQTLYYAYSTKLTAEICRILGEKEKAEKYEKLFTEIRLAFRRNFMRAGNVIFNDTQSAYLLSYAFGLASKEEIKPHLLRKIKEKDYHVACGFCGVKYILPILCDIGESDIAYRLAAETTYPSWGYSVVNGATTIWERWNSYTHKDGFADEAMNSFNHYSLGSCAEWMYRYVLGIRSNIENPGFDEVILQPFPDFSGKVNKAEGSYKTASGEIFVRWERRGDCVYYSYTAPVSMTVKLQLDGLTAEKISENEFLLRRV